ncbi:MAG: hypothetical protein LUE16_09935 [Lachnospiraceae bacterium]|nr:hypothetical protein [Lachnospiraceae bacterium]
MISRIKELQIGRRTSFRLILLAELCLLVTGIWGLFGKDTIYEFGVEDATAGLGSYSEDAGGYSADGSEGQSGILVAFEEISLPRGVYRIRLLYDTDTNLQNLCYALSDQGDYKTMLSDYDCLYAGLHETSFNAWLLTGQDHFTIQITYGGNGSLTVKGLLIEETNALSRMEIFCVLIGAILVNGIYLFRQYDQKYAVAVKKKNIMFGLGLIILVASFPLMTDRIIYSSDLIYHFHRIEGIKDTLLDGQFPVRIAPEWQQGYGYASSIFYGETALYLAAAFRLIDFPVVTSYQMFWFVLAAVTVFISYGCFSRIFSDDYTGLLCSALYTLSVYRIFKTYITGSLGETLGILFLPFLALGFYRVFTEDITTKRYRRAWIPLTIGFTGLLQSHLLTGEIAGIFTILLCVILWKKVFRRQTFVVLAKTVIYSCLLSAWFLIPFVDYMISGDFVIQHVSARTIQDRGLYFAQLFQTFFRFGENVLFDETGMYESQPMGVGIGFILALLIWVALLFFHKTERMDPGIKGLGKVSAAFAVLAMLMSLSVFPWDRIQNLSSVTATLVSSIQFPNRFLTMATLCLTLVAGAAAVWMKENFSGRGLAAYGLGLAALAVTGILCLSDDMMQTSDNFLIYNMNAAGTGYIVGEEYLPYGTDTASLVYRDPVAEDNVAVESYEKDGGTIWMKCSNESEQVGSVSLPLLYYKGYQAKDVETGESLLLYGDSGNIVSVDVPAGYSGTILVSFVSPWYWRTAEILSVVVFFWLLADAVWSSKKRRKQTCGKSQE